jgi:tetratricopeptide (TPR) repeat protein/predicted aspartyl protease
MNWPTGRSHSSPLRRAHIFLQNHSGYSLARIWPLAIASLTLAVLPDLSVAKCQVGKVVELPITMAGLVPLVPVKINGKDAKFILDSGAFYSMMSAATAAEYELKLKAAPDGLSVHGIGGFISTSVANVREFTVAGITIHDVQFLVGGSEVGSSGILGQNLLEKWDVEYDFAKGIVTLIKTDDCKNAVLAYWVAPGQSFSAMDLTRMGIRDFHTIGEGYINGMKIRVEFDTGAGASVLTLKAAARAGVKTDSPGVVDAGYGRGIGRALAKQYIAPFASFKIGDGEEIKNARLRISDVDLGDADMLLGADFFVSHHVYIANSQHKAYLTYNGGPIFDLSKLSSPDAASAAVSSADPATASDAPKKADDEPATAEALARRGAAFAARHDYEHALADLTRACELDPNNPEYLFQRGVVRWRNSEADLALADFNRVLELNSDYVPALMDRAELRIRSKDISGARADLDSVDRVAAKQADVRYELAIEYQRADIMDSAIVQFETWTLSHAVDSKFPAALNNLCFSRAVVGQNLDKALSNCNQALKLAAKASPFNASVLNNRGLVWLRLGDYPKSIADFDACLKLSPKFAWSLYGRGVAKIREKDTAVGEADVADAVKLEPGIEEKFKKLGITP